MGYFSFPYRAFRPQANEQQLERIYAAAKVGLTGDALAHRCSIDPVDYYRLRELDPEVERAENKGVADGQAEIAAMLYRHAIDDHRAALAILQNKHGWVAKKEINVNVEEKISISVALERAKSRVIEADFTEVDEIAGPGARSLPAPARTLTSLEAARSRAMPAFIDDDDE